MSDKVEGYTPDKEEVRIKYVLASGSGRAAHLEFDRWFEVVFSEAAAEAYELGYDNAAWDNNQADGFD